MKRELRFPLAGFALAALITGCAQVQIEPDTLEDVAGQVAAEEAKAEAFQNQKVWPGRAQALHVPPDALWLGQARHVRFDKPVPARLAITALADPVAVMFLMEEGNDPLIRPGTGNQILLDYLDQIAVQSDWVYEVVDGVLVFRDWQTTTIPIASLVGKLTGLLSSTTGVSTAVGQNQFETETDPYAEIEAIVEGILMATPNEAAQNDTIVRELVGEPVNVLAGAVQAAEAQVQALVDSVAVPDDAATRKPTFSVSRAANMLFVAARPNQVRAVNEAIAHYNESVSKRVVVNVLIYDVTLNAGEERSLDLAALLDLSRLSGRLEGTSLDFGLGGSNSLSIQNVPRGTPQVNQTLDLQSLLLRWIETQGSVSNRMQRRFEALNNRPVTFLDTTEIEYVKGLEEETEEGSNIVTRTEILGQHQVGRAFSLFPTIADQRVNIQMTINSRTAFPKARGVSELDAGSTASVLYDIENTDRVIPLSLEDGETRVLTYFSSGQTQTDESRNRLLPWIADGRDNRRRLNETVIAITARIVE